MRAMNAEVNGVVRLFLAADESFWINSISQEPMKEHESALNSSLVADRQLTSGFAAFAAFPGLGAAGLPPKKLRISEGMVECDHTIWPSQSVIRKGKSRLGRGSWRQQLQIRASDALRDVTR